MPNVSEKKIKLLFLAKLLLEQTDSEHTLTLPEILDELEKNGVSAERKSIYGDLETLKSAGLNIETRKEKTFQYFIAERKIPFDAVKKIHASLLSDKALSGDMKKITEYLCCLCSKHQGDILRKQAAEFTPAEKPPADTVRITLDADNDSIELVKEKFGDAETEEARKNKTRLTVDGEVGPELFAWLFAHGQEVKVISPKKLAEQMRERAKAVAKQYKN